MADASASDDGDASAASIRAGAARRKSWAQGGVGRLEEAKKKLEQASGVSLALPPKPGLERRQSSRLKNRAAAAPYPAPSSSGSTGITPMMRSGMELEFSPSEEANDLAKEVLADLDNVRKTIRRASTGGVPSGRPSAVDEMEEVSGGSAEQEEASLVEERRSQSMPVHTGRDSTVRMNDITWREKPARHQASSVSEGGKRRSTQSSTLLMEGEVAVGEEEEEGGGAESAAVESHVAEINENLHTLKVCPLATAPTAHHCSPTA